MNTSENNPEPITPQPRCHFSLRKRPWNAMSTWPTKRASSSCNRLAGRPVARWGRDRWLQLSLCQRGACLCGSGA
eukprot:10885111-Lingulodinium_polyedra.AAC.1